MPRKPRKTAESVPEAAPTRRSSRAVKQKKVAEWSDEEEEEEVMPQTKRRGRQSTAVVVAPAASDSDESSADEVQPTVRRRRGRGAATAANDAPAERKPRGRRGRAGAELAPAPEVEQTVEPPKRGRRGRRGASEDPVAESSPVDEGQKQTQARAPNMSPLATKLSRTPSGHWLVCPSTTEPEDEDEDQPAAATQSPPRARTRGARTTRAKSPIVEKDESSSSSSSSSSSTTVSEESAATRQQAAVLSIKVKTPEPVREKTPEVQAPVRESPRKVTPQKISVVETTSTVEKMVVKTPEKIVPTTVKTPEKSVPIVVTTPEKIMQPAVKTPEKVVQLAAKTPEKVVQPAVKTPEKVVQPAVKTPEKVVQPAVKTPEKVVQPAVQIPEKIVQTAIPTPERIVQTAIITPEKVSLAPKGLTLTPGKDVTPQKIVTPTKTPDKLAPVADPVEVGELKNTNEPSVQSSPVAQAPEKLQQKIISVQSSAEKCEVAQEIPAKLPATQEAMPSRGQKNEVDAPSVTPVLDSKAAAKVVEEKMPDKKSNTPEKIEVVQVAPKITVNEHKVEEDRSPEHEEVVCGDISDRDEVDSADEMPGKKLEISRKGSSKESYRKEKSPKRRSNERSESDSKRKDKSASPRRHDRSNERDRRRGSSRRSPSPKSRKADKKDSSPVRSRPSPKKTARVSLKRNRLSEETREQEIPAEGPTKKRRWGLSRMSSTPSSTSIVISSETLKEFIPDAKLVPEEEVTKMLEEETPVTPLDMAPAMPTAHSTQKAVDDDDEDISVPVRKVSIMHSAKVDTGMHSPTPPRFEPSCILHISNLVRPFTAGQLKELLSRTGNIVEGKFWTDKVKSRCIVEYNTEEQARTTRHALHGIQWPVTSNKTLIVDFATRDLLEKHLNSTEDPPPRAEPIRKLERIVTSNGTAVPEREEVRRAEIDLSKKKATDLLISDLEERAVQRRKKAEAPIREWDMHKIAQHDEPRRELGERRRNRSASTSPPRKFKKKTDDAPPKMLDDLFRKTKATPCIYWLPLTTEQIAEKEKMRIRRLEEHERRRADMRREREAKRSPPRRIRSRSPPPRRSRSPHRSRSNRRSRSPRRLADRRDKSRSGSPKK